jgi:hypothetical protein
MDKDAFIHALRSLTTLVYIRTHDYIAWEDYTLYEVLKKYVVLRVNDEQGATLVPTSFQKSERAAARKEKISELANVSAQYWHWFKDLEGKKPVAQALQEALAQDTREFIFAVLVQGADGYFHDPEVVQRLRAFTEQARRDSRTIKMVLMFGTAPLPETLKPYTFVIDDTPPDREAIQEHLKQISAQLMAPVEVDPDIFKGYSLFQIDSLICRAMVHDRKHPEGRAVREDTLKVFMASVSPAYPLST